MSMRHRLQAWGGLMQHYSTVFWHFWKSRHAMPTDFFNKHEAQFLPASLSLQEMPSSSSLRWTARVLMALVIFTVLWSIFGHIDITVNAAGKIIPSARTKTIGSVDIASVRALYVTEGQEVRRGDVLIELDSSSSDAEHDKAVNSVAQARLLIARSQSMISAVDHLQTPQLGVVKDVTPAQWQLAKRHLDGQYRDFYAKLIRINGEISRYTKALPLATQRAEDFNILRQDHTVSQHAWLEKEQLKIEIESQLLEAKNQRAALIAQTRKEAHDAMTEVPKQSVVEVEAFLENKDVGFVRIGQTAEVKIDAFDYTKYGTTNAKVKHVSHDAIEDEKRGLIYATRVALDKNSIVVDGKLLPLSAGMSVNVEIKTGTRRVIEYVLSPLMRHQREALHER